MRAKFFSVKRLMVLVVYVLIYFSKFYLLIQRNYAVLGA